MRLVIEIFKRNDPAPVWRADVPFQFVPTKDRWEAAHSAIEIPGEEPMGIDVECTEQTKALHLIVVRGSTFVADFGASWLGGGTVSLLVTPLYRLRALIDLELIDEKRPDRGSEKR